MALEIEGKIVHRQGIQQGTSARGNWAKQEFIVEYQDGNYPTQVCFNVWGEDKVRDLERFQDGDRVKIAFRPSSREYNGKWYTDLRAWRIEPAGTGSGAGFGSAAGAPAPSPQTPPMPTAEDIPNGLNADDDLPF